MLWMRPIGDLFGRVDFWSFVSLRRAMLLVLTRVGLEEFYSWLRGISEWQVNSLVLKEERVVINGGSERLWFTAVSGNEFWGRVLS